MGLFLSRQFQATICARRWLSLLLILAFGGEAHAQAMKRVPTTKPPWQRFRAQPSGSRSSKRVPTQQPLGSKPGSYSSKKAATGASPTSGERRMPQVNEVRPDVEGSVASDLWFLLQTGPVHPVRGMTVSPDGRFLASAGDAMPRVWRIDSGEVVRELSGHQNIVTAAVFSSDGDYVLTGGGDSYARLWHWRTGKLVQAFGPHRRIYDDTPLAISRDGKIVLTLDLTANSLSQIVLWDRHSGKVLRRLQPSIDTILAAAFSPDARRLVAGTSSGNVSIHRVDGSESRVAIRGHLNKRISAVAFSSDGKYVVSASHDQTARIWDSKTGKQLRLLAGHTGAVTDARFSTDGRYVVTSSADATARLWRTADGKELKRIASPDGSLAAAALTPDSRQLVTAGQSRALHVFDVESGKQVRRLGGYVEDVTSAVINDAQARLVTSSRNELRIWDLKTGRQIQRRAFDDEGLSQIVVSPGGRYAAVQKEASVTLVDLHSGDPGVDLKMRRTIDQVLFTSDDKEILLVTSAGMVGAWTCDSAKPRDRRTTASPIVGSAVVSPSGSRLLAVRPREIDVWDMEADKVLKTLEVDHKQAGDEPPAAVARGAFYDAVFSSDGSVFVTLAIHSRPNPAPRAAASPSGAALVEYVVWDAETLAETKRFQLSAESLGPSIISPDNRSLIVCEGAAAHLVDLKTGRRIRTFAGHDDEILSVVLSTGGARLVTTSRDQTCRIWNVASGEEIALLAGLTSGGWVVVDNHARFDGANGGEVEGVHWVVDGEVISLHQLKKRYYEPQLLAKVLGYDTEPRREVASFATPKLFPDVKIASANPDGTLLNIRLHNRGGGIGRVVVKLNGKELAADARGDQVDPGSQSAEIILKLADDPRIKAGEENVVEVVAYNQEDYLASRGLRFVFQGRPRKTEAAPQVWAIVAGVSDYRGDRIDLRYAAKDALDFSLALQLSASRLFGAGNVHRTLLTTDEQDASHRPTRRNIVDALVAARASRPSDVFVIYLSGHGVNHGGPDGDFYFLAADAEDAQLTDPSLRATTAISSAEFADLIKQIPALKQVMILDTCASGRFVQKLTERRNVPSSQIRALERVKDRTGTHVLAGCTADAVSYESSRYGQGLLTHSLLLGIRGAALRENEFVDVLRLFSFAADRVPEMAAGVGGVQRPVIASPKGGGSFDIGRVTDTERNEIPIQLPLPLVLRANFQDEVNFDDTLALAKLVNEDLRNASARGRESSLVFVDALELPQAYRLAGRYTIDRDDVAIQVHLFQGQKRVTQFEIAGNKSDVPALAEKIVAETRTRLQELNR